MTLVASKLFWATSRSAHATCVNVDQSKPFKDLLTFRSIGSSDFDGKRHAICVNKCMNQNAVAFEAVLNILTATFTRGENKASTLALCLYTTLHFWDRLMVLKLAEQIATNQWFVGLSTSLIFGLGRIPRSQMPPMMCLCSRFLRKQINVPNGHAGDKRNTYRHKPRHPHQ